MQSNRAQLFHLFPLYTAELCHLFPLCKAGLCHLLVSTMNQLDVTSQDRLKINESAKGRELKVLR